jgi:hypothetical protein
MENLSPESKVLYLLLKVETKEVYKNCFTNYKKEMIDAVYRYIKDTSTQIMDVASIVEPHHIELRSRISQGDHGNRAQGGQAHA